jgi:anti-anti-sigma factor
VKFKINIHKLENNIFILDLEGQFTDDSSQKFHNALIPILQKSPKAVSINLSNIDTIDEAGIAMLMNGLMGSSNQGTYLYLVGLPDKVKEYYDARLEDFGHPFFSTTLH